jgi:hypothetical protein
MGWIVSEAVAFTAFANSPVVDDTIQSEAKLTFPTATPVTFVEIAGAESVRVSVAFWT